MCPSSPTPMSAKSKTGIPSRTGRTPSFPPAEWQSWPRTLWLRRERGRFRPGRWCCSPSRCRERAVWLWRASTGFLIANVHALVADKHQMRLAGPFFVFLRSGAPHEHFQNAAPGDGRGKGIPFGNGPGGRLPDDRTDLGPDRLGVFQHHRKSLLLFIY